MHTAQCIPHAQLSVGWGCEEALEHHSRVQPLPPSAQACRWNSRFASTSGEESSERESGREKKRGEEIRGMRNGEKRRMSREKREGAGNREERGRKLSWSTEQNIDRAEQEDT